MDKFKNILAETQQFSTPWLDPLPFDWKELELIGTEISYNKHAPIFDSYETTQHVFLVKKGRVRLYLLSDLGEEKAIAIIGKNGLLGVSSVFLDQNYYTNAITASPAILLRIDTETFKRKILENPLYSEQLFKMMSLKLLLLYQHSLDLSYSSSSYRVRQTLSQLALTYGESEDNQNIKIQVSFTHQELANVIGTTRVTVANHIKTLIDHGLISKAENLYIIHDLARLISFDE
ncbi:Crp/Fnr family transcriptional regulator [Robertmurraya massiliosenegalensis]|uniref:Crp/Fnr family transcriptional regulator n=1 Tax=Robertmurraya TaxID=2837507 RepID=UPI0039A6752C